jgi:hypothetical protein
MEIVVPQPYHGVGLDDNEGESSSDDEIAVQDVSPGNPFLREDDDDVNGLNNGDEDSDSDNMDDDEELSDDEDGEDVDPEDVDMFLGNHEDEEEDDDGEGEDEDDDENNLHLMDEAEDDGIQGLPTAADLADIEEVFGQDNGNIFLEEPDDDDEDDNAGSCFCLYI